MSSLNTPIDVRLLVRWLGYDGAKAGLEKSKSCTVETLREVAIGLGIDVPSKPKRQDLVGEIIRIASRRIDKSVDEMQRMQREELVRYFEEREVEPHELLELLKNLDMDPGRQRSSKSRRVCRAELEKQDDSSALRHRVAVMLNKKTISCSIG